MNDLPAWPKPATTDADGRFTLHGVGRGLQATLSIIDSRFALQMFEVETDNSPDAKPVTMALRPAQIITGRVTYADTGKPVPHARLIVNAMGGGQRGSRPTDFQTDADGRFRANPSPGDRFSVNAAPPAGQPYLGDSKTFAWPKGAIEHSLDLSLPRGVLIRGKVTEEGSHHPVAEARVVFLSTPWERCTPAARAAERRRWRMDRSSSPARPNRVIWSSRAPARITCSRKSAVASSSRVSRVACACIPTPSSPTTRNRAASARK